MTKEEYKSKLKAAEERYILEVNKIKKEYAMSNNPVRIGDVIKDHYHTIKVEAIRVICYEMPECVYRGTRLKADGKTPHSNQSDNEIYQGNIKFINGRKYEKN